MILVFPVYTLHVYAFIAKFLSSQTRYGTLRVYMGQEGSLIAQNP